MDLAALDKSQLEKRGMTLDDIDRQLDCFKKGTQYVKLLRAATVGDGIFRFNEADRARIVKQYDEVSGSLKIEKFVPASGAATRMFKRVFQWIESPEDHEEDINAFFKRAEELALFELWLAAADQADIETFQSGLNSKVSWLKLLVEASGLDYAVKPKALLPFHLYDAPSMPITEHVREALEYAQGTEGKHIHFTVSPEHLDALQKAVDEAIAAQNAEGVSVSYSHQKPSTDTVAVTPDGAPVEVDGSMVFRPGGHGALIHNLNDLDADVVFIKNIDNVAHKRLLADTVEHKKLLGGVLVEVRADFTELLKQVQKGLVDQTSIDQCREKWGLRIPRDYQKLKNYLERPIRVCGMVKNEGEPGGGPFWCLDKNTGESLQIVEQSQVNREDFRQSSILKSATHFNPVDLVCSLKNLEGKKIDLHQYVDEDQYFIADKSINGQAIKALEWPGLWNGAMAHWVTMFVEVPISTFNPVKEVSDLLRPNHLPSEE